MIVFDGKQRVPGARGTVIWVHYLGQFKDDRSGQALAHPSQRKLLFESRGPSNA